MTAAAAFAPRRVATELLLPLTLLARYLTLLARRPASRSNQHFVARRLTGLRSLLPLLDGPGSPVTPELRRELLALTPATLEREAQGLSARLHALLPARPAAAAVHTSDPPPARWLAGLRRVRVAFGPGIGIGDEIACATLVDHLRLRLPGAAIRVTSAYPGVWPRVAAVDEVELYEREAELIAALRGGGDDELTVFVDFESPNLLAAWTADASARPYVELELGRQRARAYDPGRGRVHTLAYASAYDPNLYRGLRALLTWLFGALGRGPEAPSPWPRTAGPATDGPLAVLVTPFTAKYDPELDRWSRLLRGLVRARPGLRICVDTGPSRATAGFTRALVAAVAGEADVSAAVTAIGPGASELSDVLAAIGRAALVLGVDTFAAHAAPRLGAAAVILAPPGLEYWRVPAPRSFYLPEAAAVDAQIAAVDAVVEALAGGGPRASALPHLRALARPLVALARALARALAGAGEDPAAAWRRFHAAWLAALDDATRWPVRFDALLADADYAATRADALARDEDGAWDEASAEYARQALAERGGTNLGKYLALCAGEADG